MQLLYDKEKAYKGKIYICKNWSAYKDPNYGKFKYRPPWTVDSKMALTNNTYFMHCLPVRRNMIVSDEVIEDHNL